MTPNPCPKTAEYFFLLLFFLITFGKKVWNWGWPSTSPLTKLGPAFLSTHAKSATNCPAHVKQNKNYNNQNKAKQIFAIPFTLPDQQNISLLYFAAPAQARGCSTNTVVIDLLDRGSFPQVKVIANQFSWKSKTPECSEYSNIFVNIPYK